MKPSYCNEEGDLLSKNEMVTTVHEHLHGQIEEKKSNGHRAMSPNRQPEHLNSPSSTPATSAMHIRLRLKWHENEPMTKQHQPVFSSQASQHSIRHAGKTWCPNTLWKGREPEKIWSTSCDAVMRVTCKSHGGSDFIRSNSMVRLFSDLAFCTVLFVSVRDWNFSWSWYCSPFYPTSQHWINRLCKR